MRTFDEKLVALAALITDDGKQEYLSNGYTLEHHNNNWVASIKPGKKYTKIDVGTSGKYMVDNATGEIFGIKGYGTIHRGHRYGTLDTIEDFNWGGYVARIKSENIYWKEISADVEVIENAHSFTACGKLVFWHGQEAGEAQRALKQMAGKQVAA